MSKQISEANILFFSGGNLKDKDNENNVGLSAIRIRDVSLFEDDRDNPSASIEIGHKNY